MTTLQSIEELKRLMRTLQEDHTVKITVSTNDLKDLRIIWEAHKERVNKE